MPQYIIDREKVFKSLPGDRRTIMKKTGLRSYEVPPILRLLQRRCLADNLTLQRDLLNFVLDFS